MSAIREFIMANQQAPAIPTDEEIARDTTASIIGLVPLPNASREEWLQFGRRTSFLLLDAIYRARLADARREAK